MNAATALPAPERAAVLADVGMNDAFPPVRLASPPSVSVYIAAPLAQKSRARYFAAVLANHGFRIASRWQRSEAMADPLDSRERFDALSQNLGDIERCDVLLALCDIGTPRATFGEISWALGRGKRVLWAHGDDGVGRNIFDAHRLVRRVNVGGAATSWARIVAELDALARELNAS